MVEWGRIRVHLIVSSVVVCAIAGLWVTRSVTTSDAMKACQGTYGPLLLQGDRVVAGYESTAGKLDHWRGSTFENQLSGIPPDERLTVCYLEGTPQPTQDGEQVVDVLNGNQRAIEIIQVEVNQQWPLFGDNTLEFAVPPN